MIEGDPAIQSSTFMLPYAGVLQVRVRTAVVEPRRRRKAEEEAARVRMERILGEAAAAGDL